MRTLIFIPTYNERDNLEPIHQRIKRLGLRADVLLLDDNSPDGTGQVADRLAAADPSTSVIHRPGKNGIGSAHLEGIRWAYKRGYEVLVTMDSDLTHQPEDVPAFLEGTKTHDVVVGSRYMDPNSLKEWTPFRRMLTAGGHFLTRHLLGLPQDTSGAFRAYRLDRVPLEAFEKVTSRGYAFFFESLNVLVLNGFSIKEIPIILPARACGRSKMTVLNAVKGLWRLFETAARVRLNPAEYKVSRSCKV